MQNIDLIGDSHVDPIGLTGKSLNLMSKYKDLKIYRIQGKSAFSIDFESIGYTFRPDSTVVLMFGYIDCKVFALSTDIDKPHSSAPEVAKLYVDRAIDYFKNCKIVFVQPFPQFKKLDHVVRIGRPFPSFDVRYQRHKELSYSLEEYAHHKGKQYISLNPFFGKEWLHSPTKLYQDHLDEEKTMAKTLYILENIK